MMSDELLIFALEYGYGLLTIIILIICFRNWYNNKDIIDLALFLVLTISALDSIDNIYLRICNYFSDVECIVYISDIELHTLVVLAAGSVYLWFLFYLNEWKKYYSLPFIMSLYFGVYSSQSGNVLISEIYVLIIMTTAGLFFSERGIKNQDGFLFSIGISIFLYLLNDAVEFLFGNIDIIYYLIQYLSSIVLLLGVTRWLDRNVFYDRDYRKEISTTWIGSKIRKK